MKYRLLHNNPLQFYDTNAELVGTISANGSNLKITSNSGVIELGNTASDIQVGALGTPITWTFLGGGTIGAGGIGTINMGQSGDTINMNVAGVTYQYPASFLRYNEITGTNNKINITTQVPGSVVLSLPQRPVVGQLQLTDAVPSTSNLTGALTVAGGVGIAGNLSVTNATINGQLGISAPNDLAARLKITSTGSGVVFNQADNSNIYFQTQGVNRLTIFDTTGNGTLQGNLTVQGASTSVSNTTGALIVSGGAGIRGNVYADSIILPQNPTGTTYGAQTFPPFYIGGVVADNDGWKIYAEAPVTNEGRLVFQVEDDTTETFLWRSHQFYSTGTKDLATLNTAIFSVSSNVANFRIRNTTGSTSTSSGAAIIDGGLGVAGNVYSGGVYDTGVNIIGFAGRAYNHANAAFTSANLINGVDVTQNNSITAAFTRANNSISANAGGTITGDLSITGNLFVTGNTVSVTVGTVAANDTLIVLGIGNYVSDISDIGLAGHYNDGTNAHSGIIRDTGNKEWYLFKGYTPDIGANNNVDINHASFIIDTLNANLRSNLVTLKGYDTLTYINSAFSVANSAAIYANGAFAAANASGIYANGAFAAANNRVLKSGDTMTGNLVINSSSSHGLIVSNTSTGGTIAFGGTNGRTLTALQGGAASNFDFNANQVYYNGDLLVGGKLSSPNGSTANLFLTASYNGGTIYTDRGVYVACTNAAVSNSSGSLVLNGGVGIGGNFYNAGGSGLYISANTFGDGGTNSGANSLVYINQTNGWSGNQPWSLFVNGYSNLSGLRMNGSDTPRAIHKVTSGNLGFSLSDSTSVISFGPQNGTFAFTVAPPYNTAVSANNYIQVRPGNTGVNANGVFITVEGVDANSDINIVPKGINGKVNIYSTVASTSNTTGALVVKGGVGVGGRIYGSSDVYLGDGTGNQNGSSLTWNGSYPTFIQGSSGVGSSGYLRFVVGNSGVVGFGIEGSGNYTRIDYSTVATSNTTGALQIIGGVGIRGNVYSGGIYLTGASSNGITFVDGTKQTSAGAVIGDVLALSIALG